MSDLFPIPHATRPALAVARERLHAAMASLERADAASEELPLALADAADEVASARAEVARLESLEMDRVRRSS